MLSSTQMIRHRSCVVGTFALCLLIALATASFADPAVSLGGTYGLAISGLEIDLPPLPDGQVYHVSGSFALSEEGTYDGRDVIDEVSGEDLSAGTWVSVGYFDAGTPADVVNGIGLAQSWTTQIDLWGGAWSVAGGIFTFEGELGEKPALVACTQRGDGKALLIHRFFLTEPTTMTQSEMIAQFEQAAVARAVWTSYDAQRTAQVLPLTRPEVRSRGDKDAARWEYLETSLLEVEIPADGFVWLVRAEPDQGVDFLDRMAPALPEVSLEVLTLPGQTCSALFESIPLEKRAVSPQNLADGWTAGPQIVVENNLELTACYQNDNGIVVIGVFQGPTDTDVGPLADLFDAIKEAADIP